MERKRLIIPLLAALSLCSSAGMAAPLVGAAPEGASQALVEAMDAAEHSPEDYAAMTALARQARAEGHLELCLDAWAEAERISGGNFETAAGQVEPALAHGDHRLARRAASEAVALAPDNAAAHLLMAEVWYQAPPAVPRALSHAKWENALATAAELRPDDVAVQCHLGWARLAVGDRLGARRAFVNAYDGGAPCASEGLAETEAAWSSTGGVYTSVLAYPTDANLGSGASLAATGSASYGDLVTVEILGRKSHLNTFDDRGFDAFDLSQSELWGRARLSHRGHGAELLLGTGTLTGDTLQNASAIGGRAWFTRGVTLWGEAARSTYTDGVNTQAAVGVSIPLATHLRFDAGLSRTELRATPGMGAESSGPHLSALLALTATYSRLTLSGGVRLGEEVRPIRLMEPGFWNLDGSIGSSAFVRAAVEVQEGARIYAGYDLVAEENSGLATPWGHVVSIGLEKTIGGRLP